MSFLSNTIPSELFPILLLSVTSVTFPFIAVTYSPSHFDSFSNFSLSFPLKNILSRLIIIIFFPSLSVFKLRVLSSSILGLFRLPIGGIFVQPKSTRILQCFITKCLLKNRKQVHSGNLLFFRHTLIFKVAI